VAPQRLSGTERRPIPWPAGPRAMIYRRIMHLGSQRKERSYRSRRSAARPGPPPASRGDRCCGCQRGTGSPGSAADGAAGHRPARLLHEVTCLASMTACWLSLSGAIPACGPAAFGGVDGDGREAGAGQPVGSRPCAAGVRYQIARFGGPPPGLARTRTGAHGAASLRSLCRPRRHRRCRPHDGRLVPGR
jgi:hypothetical protein